MPVIEVRQAVKRFELTEKAKAEGDEMSGGMKRRLLK
jgi:ABC-type multidrug transport system ATPase subunit